MLYYCKPNNNHTRHNHQLVVYHVPTPHTHPSIYNIYSFLENRCGGAVFFLFFCRGNIAWWQSHRDERNCRSCCSCWLRLEKVMVAIIVPYNIVAVYVAESKYLPSISRYSVRVVRALNLSYASLTRLTLLINNFFIIIKKRVLIE